METVVKDEETETKLMTSESRELPKLPEALKNVSACAALPRERHCWNTNEEIAAILIAFDKHEQWQQEEVHVRPASGSMLLYRRSKVRYRKDGYYWKKRRDGKTTREDHMKLKVQGAECIYGCYVHSAILPTFHRRSYWLLQNPDVVLVHYLNVPVSEESKMAPMPTLTIQPHKEAWSLQELLDQLNPMFASEDSAIAAKFTEQMTGDAIRKIAKKLLAGQKPAEYTCSVNCRCEKCGKMRSSSRNNKHSISQQLLSYASKSRPAESSQSGSTSVLVKTGSKAQPVSSQTAAKAPLILNLSQLPNSNRLIILNTGGTKSPLAAIARPHAVYTQANNVDLNNQIKTFTVQNPNLNVTGSAGQSAQVPKQNVVRQVNGSGLPNANLQSRTAQHIVFPGSVACANPILKQPAVTKPDISFSGNDVKPAVHANQDDGSHDGVEQMATSPVHVGLKDSKNFQELFGDHRRHSEGDSILAKQTCASSQPSSQPKQGGLHRSHTISSPVDVRAHVHVPQRHAYTKTCYSKLPVESRLQSSTSAAIANTIVSQRASSPPDDVGGGGVMTTAQMQMAESDMVVDNLVRELNLQNNSSSQSSPFHSFSSSFDDPTAGAGGVVNGNGMVVTPMQTSPTSQLLSNLEDFVDLSFLDSDKLPADDALLTSQMTSQITSLSSPADEFVSSHESQPKAATADGYSLHSGLHEEHAHIAQITDFCPEFASTRGGVKVLVTGPWYAANSIYVVLFDGVAVPARRVQSGVLRCYSPEHKPGHVRLQVACDGHIISNSVAFEFRASHEISNESVTQDECWYHVSDDDIKTKLLKRLAEVEKRLAPSPDSMSPALVKLRQYAQQEGVSRESVEMPCVQCVGEYSARPWLRANTPVHSADRLSLLHLAAALGYSALIQALLEWKCHRPSLLLDYEVDALNLDSNCCTPLVWACCFGHVEAAKILYSWRPSALSVANKDGKLPLQIACERGYSQVSDALMQNKDIGGEHAPRSPTHAFRQVAPGESSTPPPHTTTATPPLSLVHTDPTDLAPDCAFDLTCEETTANLLTSFESNLPPGPEVKTNPADLTPNASLNGSDHERWFTPPKSPLPKTASDSHCNIPHNAPNAQSALTSAHNSVTSSRSAVTSSHSTATPALGDEHLFKVPNPPLHSTPKASPTAHAQTLSVAIPASQGAAESPAMQQVTSKSRRSHETSRDGSGAVRNKLLKRISVEVLPDYPGSDPPRPASTSDLVVRDPVDQHQIRARSLTLEEMSGQHLNAEHGLNDLHLFRNDPMISMNSRDLNSPIMFMSDTDAIGLTLQDIRQQHTAMETDSSSNSSCTSGSELYVDDNLESASQDQNHDNNQGNQMATLANQIIAAMPERIKLSPSRSDDVAPEEFSVRRDRSSSYDSFSSTSSTAEALPPPPPCSVTEDSGISTPLEGIAFEDYRYPDLSTPTSSLSPASSLHSPYVDHFSMDSPPPTTAEFNEYFNAPQTFMEKDFSQLTLSDAEQRKLYEAAKIIQNFYRRYKDRQEQQMRQRQKEVEAAVLIQTYYRRYKQYIYTKKMTQAAVLIQSQFRSYYAQKRFKQSRQAATLIQNRYRAYKEQERYKKRKDAAVLIQQRFRNHYQRKRGRKGSGQQTLSQDKCQEGGKSRQASSSSLSDGVEPDRPTDAPQSDS